MSSLQSQVTLTSLGIAPHVGNLATNMVGKVKAEADTTVLPVIFITKKPSAIS